MSNDVVINIEGKSINLSAIIPFWRYDGNPILTAADVNKAWNAPHLKVVTVHNAGISLYNGKYIMLFRSHLRNGISVIGKALSSNGLNEWEIDDQPFLKPCNADDHFAPGCNPDIQIQTEGGGVEDPRISLINGKYYITYSGYHATSQDQVRVCLAATEDFIRITRFGPVLDQDMRNVVIFPEKTGALYYALFRPNDDPSSGHTGGAFREICMASTSDLENNSWNLAREPVMKQAGGPSPFQHKIGPGAPPLKTKHGWVSIFHGVRSTMDGNPYVLGVALHDLEDPASVRVSSIPLVFPTPGDCRTGEGDYVHVPQVVFTCGAIRETDGTIRVYYGGNDTVMNVGFTHEDVVAELCNRYPADAMTGKPIYKI